MDELERTLAENNDAVVRINSMIVAIEKRAHEIRVMVDCVNSVLDSSMNDRDQILSVEECMRKAAYR